MNRFKFYLFYLLFFVSQLTAIPSDEVYWQRVKEGMWIYDNNIFPQYVKRKMEFVDVQKLARVEAMAKQIVRKERELQGDYYQFITSQDPLFIPYQMILKELYQFIYGRKFENYQFLRPYRDPDLHEDIYDFVSKYPELFVQDWTRNDTSSKVSRQIISASHTLETRVDSASALYVFCNGGAGVCDYATKQMIVNRLVEAFKIHGMDENLVRATLTDLVEKGPNSSHGILMQVFVPKKEVGSMVYLSKSLGYIKTDQNPFIERYIGKIQAARDSKQFVCEKSLQVRLLAGALDPDKVKIYRYSIIDDATLINYEKLVAEKMAELFSDYLQLQNSVD